MSSMNSTPSGDRVHIGIFGRRNAGKSSVINAMTGQSLSIVSEVKGTTTDPVQKAMELLPLGPVVLIDTPGIDDEGELGSLRVRRSYQMLNKADLALLVVDGAEGFLPEDLAILQKIQEKKIPYLIAANKSDQARGTELNGLPAGESVLWVSAKRGRILGRSRIALPRSRRTRSRNSRSFRIKSIRWILWYWLFRSTRRPPRDG